MNLKKKIRGWEFYDDHPRIYLKGTEEKHLIYRTQCLAFCTVYYVLNMTILKRVWRHQVIQKSQYLQASYPRRQSLSHILRLDIPECHRGSSRLLNVSMREV